jgi:hypothetical protein
VVEVARLVKQELDRAGLHGALKTSGSSGLHIYLPLPARTPLETSTLLAQFIATRVARARPKIATVERMVKRRPRGTVYVDYLQNILGKTVAGVYAVRAKPGGTVSTPLSWDELTTSWTCTPSPSAPCPRAGGARRPVGAGDEAAHPAAALPARRAGRLTPRGADDDRLRSRGARGVAGRDRRRGACWSCRRTR